MDEAYSDLFASIHHTPIATVITDPNAPDNPIVAVNRPFCELTGYGGEEVIGRNCRLLGGPQTDPGARATLARAVCDGTPALVEMLNYRKDGTPFRNAVMIAPLLGADGKAAFFIGSQMEMTSDAAPLTGRRAAAEALVARLTPRQRQVLAHLVAGYRNKQMAGFLGIDEKTVKMHRARLLARLGAPTSADAIRIGVEAGLRLSDPA